MQIADKRKSKLLQKGTYGLYVQCCYMALSSMLSLVSGSYKSNMADDKAEVNVSKLTHGKI